MAIFKPLYQTCFKETNRPMKYSSAKNIERIGVIKGDVMDKEIPVYRVDLYTHHRTMFPFYTFINATSGWESDRATYTKVWYKIPPEHRLGDENDHHSSESYIDYLATALITFDSNRRKPMQQWWQLVLDRYTMVISPHSQDCHQDNTWVTINGALSIIGYVPSVVYGGNLRRYNRTSYATLGHLRKGCRNLTQSMVVRDSALGSSKGFNNEVFLFTRTMKEYLIIECARLIDQHNLKSQLGD